MPGSFLLGVNLAGAEFGSNVPGTFGTDYTYPTHAEIDYYASKGMSVIRLPFLWERIQHAKNGPLDSVELGRLDDVVNYTTGKGLKIEIEPHNYGYGFGALIGSAQTPNSAFADVWGKLALHFKSNPDVIFGLMNEPHDQSASTWLGSANAAIAAIRNAGASQEILVPGSYWDGAWTWTSTDNAAVIGSGVQDPAHNFAFEVHQYLDADGSGTHSGVVSATIGVERLTAITQWAEANGKLLFLGEVGVTTDQTSLTALDGMLTYMLQHTGAWQGATYWAGGPWWGNYMFSIEPQNGVDKPQMDVLEAHLGSPNHAPAVTVGNHSFEINGWSSVAGWISYTDADNDAAIQYQFWYGDTSPSAAKIWTPSGYQPALNYLTVSAADVANGNVWMGGATAAGSETMWVRASDGLDWSNWTSFTLTTGSNYTLVQGSGDYNADDNSDVLWRNDSGQVYVWEMNGLQIQTEGSVVHAAVPRDWHIQASGDFDADGRSDLFWRHDSGQVYLWEMNGLQIKAEGGIAHAAVPNDWHIQGSGDFDADGKSDILWRHDNGQVYFWEMNGFQVKTEGGVAHAAVPNDWHIQGVGDFDGDGMSDVLWRHDSGQIYFWEMNGLQVKTEGGVAHAAVPNEWHIQGVGDFDSDGNSDILWRHDNGQLYIWEMNGLQVKMEGGVAHAAVPNDWHIQSVGDFDHDGKSDILWHHDSGQVYIWEMNGLQVKAEGAVAHDWQV
jgi:endoglucanase